METQTTASNNTAPNTSARTGSPRANTDTARRRFTVTPAVDVYENADELLLVVDLPGVRQDDVTIDLHEERLTVHATRAHETSGKLVAAEFGARDYHRVFVVPQGFDGERIEARLADGVLRVRLPKSAALKPRRIAVQGA